MRDLIRQTNTVALINGFAMGGGAGLGMAAKLLIFTERTIMAQSGSSVGLGIIGPGVVHSRKDDHFISSRTDFHQVKQYLNSMGDMLSGVELAQVYQSSQVI